MGSHNYLGFRKEKDDPECSEDCHCTEEDKSTVIARRDEWRSCKANSKVIQLERISKVAPSDATHEYLPNWSYLRC